MDEERDVMTEEQEEAFNNIIVQIGGMCTCYDTTGFPSFKPLCNRGHQAGLKCHSTRKDCVDYRQICENQGHCSNTEGCLERIREANA